MSNRLFREREVPAAGPSGLKPQQTSVQLKAGDATLESRLGVQNFNEKIERWFGMSDNYQSFQALCDWVVAF